METCIECSEQVEVVEHGQFPGVCKRCGNKLRSRKAMEKDRKAHNERSNAAHRRRCAEIGKLKQEIGCADCGYNEYACALDFDHIDGKTKIVSKLRSVKAAIEEIERHKCEVVCSNCHRVRTWKRLQE